MAAATIPELIQPGELYVPSLYNFFSVGAGGCPNTDDSLLVSAGGNRYVAYQTAVEGVHYFDDPADPMTICWWSKGTAAGATSGGTTFRPDSVFMGVYDSNIASASQATTASTVGFRWAISGAGAATDRFASFQRAVGATSRQVGYWDLGNTTAWRFFAIRSVGGSAPTLWINSAIAAFSSPSAGTAGTPGAMTTPRFGIGGHSFATGIGSFQQITEIAKVAIFPVLLTDTELFDLYDSMTSGPPSP